MGMRINFAFSRIALAVLPVLWSVTVFAGKADPVYKNGSGLAIRGYDPVAYFDQSRPVKGSPQFSHQWMGATWLFASAQHRDQFAANPERYAPQYGGYCSYAVSQGHTASIDPEAWKIVDGKLHLNYSKGVQARWEKDIPGYIEKANRNWPDLHR
jgi:YHS domain-containing protein